MKGSLICVGCGIKGVAHLTLETVGWIQAADVVCYCCSDPATVVWIKQHAADTRDLAACYSEERDRSQIYHQMIETILSYVRSNKVVCVVFYGHPGVFVYPTHQAIATARQEGYDATMLPGVSAADCLFADVGFDPSHSGCVMYEATDLLLRRRTIAPDAHLIVWQIGVVGNAGFRFGAYRNPNLQVLIDYLTDVYESDHRVCHYQASQYPMCPPVVDWMRLGDLGRDGRISAVSTLYVPPKVHRATDVGLGEAIGYLRRDASTGDVSLPPVRVEATQVVRAYVPPPDRSPLADFINRMGAEPKLLSRFLERPDVTCVAEANLNEAEAAALVARDPGRVRAAIKSIHSTVHTPRSSSDSPR